MLYFRYIIVNINLHKFIQHYSNNDVQIGTVKFYNKIASSLLNGIKYILIEYIIYIKYLTIINSKLLLLFVCFEL